jgi:hypothetical protein
MAQDLYSNLPPEIVLEQQGLNRQKEMAKALLAQGQQMSQNPAGQMVSGRYVPNSFFQNLQGPVNMILGAYLAKKGDEKSLELAKQLREGETRAMADFMEQKQGRAAVPEQTTELAGPYTSNIPMPTAVLAGKPEIKANPQAAYANLYTNPYATNTQKDYAWKGMTAPPEEFNLPEGAIRYVKNPDGTYKQVASGGEKLHTVKGNLVTSSGKVVYSAPATGEDEGFGGQGRFNKKGDYIAPGGVFIGKAEVAKDREIARSANELRQGLKEISPKDIKSTASVFGDVNQGGPISYLAKQFENPAVAAQAKINASSVMQTLQNLPPGPASDKDIAQARSSFPGYGNPKDLQDWVTNTNAMLERKINNVNQKYGSEDWYGAQGISTKNPNSAVVANPQDQAALSWANANPNDPRAAQIKQRLSGR